MDEYGGPSSGEVGWDLLSLGMPDGDVDVLRQAVVMFDGALAEGGHQDQPCWFYGRGLARGCLAERSGDPHEWSAAAVDLLHAWAQPHPDIDREALAAEAALVLTARGMATNGTDPALLDEWNADVDRLVEPGVGTPLQVRIARGIARLERHSCGGGTTDHDEGMALLRAALPEAPDDTPWLDLALYGFAVAAAVDGEHGSALAAVARLRTLITADVADPDLDQLEWQLLDSVCLGFDGPAVPDDLMRRMEQLCDSSSHLGSEAPLVCGAQRLFHTIGAADGRDNGPDLDAAVHWLERAIRSEDGDEAARASLYLGMARSRRAKLAKDDAERERAVTSLTRAVDSGLLEPDDLLWAHSERLAALTDGMGEGPVAVPPAADRAFVEGTAALDTHPDADPRARAELAMGLVQLEMGMFTVRMGGLDTVRLARHIGVAERHPDPPQEWSTLIALARSQLTSAGDIESDGSGDFGLMQLVEALQTTAVPEVRARLRGLIGLTLFTSATRHGTTHELESALALMVADPDPAAR